MSEEYVSRNKEQYLAMTIIYQALLSILNHYDFDMMELISSNTEVEYEECSVFLRKVCVSSILHKDEIIDTFSKNMKTWKFNRLPVLEQAILLLSYSHFYYTEEKTDRKVIINVAIDLAKTYLGKDDYKFVNAILENTLK